MDVYVFIKWVSAIDWHAVAGYLVVPPGIIALIYFGRLQFNSPKYSMAYPQTDTTVEAEEPWLSPLAQPRQLVPPISTTRRERYRRQAVKYIATLVIAFLTITCLPDTAVYIAREAFQSSITLPTDPVQRTAWALFLLTGFLSSFPGFRDLNERYLKYLHTQAAIPNAAKNAAQRLYDGGFELPKDGVRLNKALKDIVDEGLFHLLDNFSDIEGNDRPVGTSLEYKWAKTGYLYSGLRAVTDTDEDIFDELSDELAEIGKIYKSLQKKFAELKEAEQAFLRVHELENDAGGIDTHLSFLADEHSEAGEFLMRRRKLVGRFDAIFYRMCLFSSLMAYASGRSAESINEKWEALGFKAKLKAVPRVDWLAVIYTLAAIFAVCLVPSILYKFTSAHFIDAAQAYRKVVPKDLPDALGWSFWGVTLHGIALIFGLWLKRRYRKRSTAVGEASIQALENWKIFFACGALSFVVGTAVKVIYHGNWAEPYFEWFVLPALTGGFIALYVDVAAMQQQADQTKPLNRYRLQHIAAMAVVSAFTVLIFYSPKTTFNVLEWPGIFWVFSAYIVLTATLVGAAIAFMFPHTYHKALRDRSKEMADLRDESRDFYGSPVPTPGG